MDSVLFTLPEEIRNKNYVVASYYIKLPVGVDIIKKASSLAVGQTIGTWIPIPGVTDEIREKYMGKVVNIFDIPAYDLSTQITEELREYIIQIAYPAVNFGDDFPLMITSLLGNDASTSAQVKLLDIEFSKDFSAEFNGPRYGIKGIRNITETEDRPLFLNMIKPCTGLSPQAGAKIFYEVALGGADLIKDDELFGNPKYSLPANRVKAYKEAAKVAYEKTGHKTRYFVNVTSGVSEILDVVKSVEDEGADGIMINFAAVGYSTLKYVAENTNMPILGHAAGSGMVCEGILNGMSTPLAVGKLARLAGADIVMVNTPYGGYPLTYQKYMETIKNLILPLYNIEPAMPSIGGGVHPGMVEKYINEVGKDIVMAAGGAVQGHPDGATAGAKAMRQAIDVAVKGESFEEASKIYPELGKALELWGYHK